MSIVVAILFIFCLLLIFAAGAVMLRRHRYRLAMAAGAAGTLLVILGCIHGYRVMEEQVVSEYNSQLNDDPRDVLENRYRQAVDILRDVPFSKPERETVMKAADLLKPFSQEQVAEKMADTCPDTEVLRAYADILKLVSAYDGHLTSWNVAENEELQEMVQKIPEDYQGTLADQIQPVRRVLLAMKAEAEKQEKLDAENQASHDRAMREGRDGRLRPGDPEERIPAVMGRPDHVHASQAGGDDIKQYMFNRNGKPVYVYTKNGVVTEIR